MSNQPSIAHGKSFQLQLICLHIAVRKRPLISNVHQTNSFCYQKLDLISLYLYVSGSKVLLYVSGSKIFPNRFMNFQNICEWFMTSDTVFKIECILNEIDTDFNGNLSKLLLLQNSFSFAKKERNISFSAILAV